MYYYFFLGFLAGREAVSPQVNDALDQGNQDNQDRRHGKGREKTVVLGNPAAQQGTGHHAGREKSFIKRNIAAH